MPCGANPIAAAAAETLRDDALVHGAIAHEPAAADLVAPGLELRLDQRDDVGAGAKQRRDTTGSTSRSEMNDTSMVTMSTGPGRCAGGR